MRITDIKVFPVREEKLKAFVSIVLDECFMINDIKVIKGKEGYFIRMPSRRKRTGKLSSPAATVAAAGRGSGRGAFSPPASSLLSSRGVAAASSTTSS